MHILIGILAVLAIYCFIRASFIWLFLLPAARRRDRKAQAEFYRTHEQDPWSGRYIKIR